MRLGPRLVLAVTGTLLLASCTSPMSPMPPVYPASPEQYLPDPAALASAVDCSTTTSGEPPATDPAAPLKGRVPDGFVPVDVVTCTLGPVSPTVILTHLSGDYAPLVAALAQPSERGGPANCLDYGEALPDIWLIDTTGQTVNIQWPMDSCGHSLPGTAAALAALTVTSTEPRPTKDATS